jgi:hypothetical protein
MTKAKRRQPAQNWGVNKTMQAGSRGAIKLTRKFGQALLCVRYRLSPDGRQRMTTVELEVECVAVQKKPNPMVMVKIHATESALIAKAQAVGARFNGRTRLWHMRQSDAQTLKLTKRIALPLRQIWELADSEG